MNIQLKEREKMSIKSKLVHWLCKDVVKEIRDDTLRRAFINFTVSAHGVTQKKGGLCAGDIIILADEFRIEIEIDEIKSA